MEICFLMCQILYWIRVIVAAVTNKSFRPWGSIKEVSFFLM